LISLLKQQTTIMLAITIAAALSTVAFASGVFTNSSESSVSSYKEGAMLMGHVTMVVQDPDGNIIKYYQGDNQITNQGENCIAEKLFGVTTTGATACQNSGGETFDVVAIGTNASPTPDEASLSLDTANTQKAVTPTVTSSTGTTSSSADVVLIATFTATTTTTFTESGVFDTTTGGSNNMLAHQAFTTGATLNNQDTIEVTWTIDIGPNGA
jgi:hypothetical protein